MYPVVAMLCALTLAQEPPEPASEVIMRTGAATLSASAVGPILADQRGRHVIVRLARAVPPGGRRALAEAGLHLVDYLGDHAWIAALDADAVLPKVVQDVAGVAPFEAAWKLHPLLAAGRYPAWTIVDGSAAHPRRVALNVLFHGDVPQPARVAAIAEQGGTIVALLTAVPGAVVAVDPQHLTALSRADAIAWIEPPLPPLTGTNDSSRWLSGAEALSAAAPHLRGAGVTAMIYDVGLIDTGHPDFTGRVTIGPADTNFVSIHSTHVAGTVGGDGRAFCGLFGGMAPEVDLLSYGFRSDADDVPLYTNVGDIEEDYAEAQALGAAVSNNSIGTNICQNGINDPVLWDCTYTGDYGVTSALIDAIALGELGHRMPIVWAAGNERACARCTDAGGADGAGYHSTVPPSCAKNPIVVGAINSDDALMTGFSSWGPCDDGRLRPDVVAPGCEAGGDFGITSTSLGGGYITACGTSMAAPVVTGLGALVVEEHRRLAPDRPDPDGATLKALIVHNATDLGAPGPDFQHGYGAVDFERTVAFLGTGHYATAELEQDEVATYGVEVTEADTSLRITVAWDDAPATPLAAGALVNDLDLTAIGPEGTVHWPWTLDPAAPAAPAGRTTADHRNNVEQVVVDDPAPGIWRIEVRGHAVPSGPQTFTLCAAPTLLTCAPAGRVALDAPRYGCEGTGVIEVVDCDLDIDDAASDTVTVWVTSDSTPEGIAVELSEIAEAAATFRGTVAFDVVGRGSPEFITVSPGDTLQVEYVDADDGAGGRDVARLAEAVIDCTAPQVTFLAVTSRSARQATLELTTSEPTTVTVLSGHDCTTLDDVTEASVHRPDHLITVDDPPDDARFVAIARDLAGNSVDTRCLALAEPDCNDNGTGDFSEIADGAAPDCDANRVPDACDIAAGAADCQADGIPDACQPDCNANGVPDDCDLSGGASPDCNANGIPDECDVVFDGPARAVTFDDPPIIEPGGAVFDTLSIDRLEVIDTVVVGVDITHSNAPSLRVRLSNGTQVVTLFDACVAPGQDLRDTVFRDDAPLSICAASPPYSGAFRPAQSLSTFSGTTTHGDWSLVVSAIDEVGCGTLDGWSLHMPLSRPDCNLNGVPDSCDITDGTSPDVDGDGVPDDCQDGCPRVAGSTPAADAIDAAQPHAADDPSVRFGWNSLAVHLVNVFGPVGPGDFTVTERGGDGRPPQIVGVEFADGTAHVLFETALEPGTWTTVTHVCSGAAVRLGYLPGDVNGDAVANPSDILELIDVLNGIATRPAYATDIDRSAATEPLDILRLIDLLNGAGAFEPWNGRTLP